MSRRSTERVEGESGDHYRPPFRLTHKVLSQVARAAELVGIWHETKNKDSATQLRRRDRIRTIKASLALEKNSLTIDQVTALLEGMPVIGPPRDIQEVKNTIAAYEAICLRGIRMTRPATPQSRLQQYRLTEPGLRRIRELRN